MMKKILFAAALLLAPMSLSAQKFAHFDLQGVVEAMPAYQTATSELEALGKQYQTNLEDMQKEYETKRQKYASEVNEKTPQNIIDRYTQELQDMQTKMEQAYNDNQKSFTEARTQKMQPILNKVLDAVNTVSKEGNYVYIIDQASAQAASIFINTAISEDVTSKVKAKLGL